MLSRDRVRITKPELVELDSIIAQLGVVCLVHYQQHWWKFLPVDHFLVLAQQGGNLFICWRNAS